MGLGLAVARGFAEAMGGTLDAEDTPGGGLTMVLTLRAGGDGGPAPDRAGPRRSPRDAARGDAPTAGPVDAAVTTVTIRQKAGPR